MTSPPPSPQLDMCLQQELLFAVAQGSLSLWSLRCHSWPGHSSVVPWGSSQTDGGKGWLHLCVEWVNNYKNLGFSFGSVGAMWKWENLQKEGKVKKENMEWQCCCLFPNLKNICTFVQNWMEQMHSLDQNHDWSNVFFPVAAFLFFRLFSLFLHCCCKFWVFHRQVTSKAVWMYVIWHTWKIAV